MKKTAYQKAVEATAKKSKYNLYFMKEDFTESSEAWDFLLILLDVPDNEKEKVKEVYIKSEEWAIGYGNEEIEHFET